jgi:RNA-directed DNA polymerase
MDMINYTVQDSGLRYYLYQVIHRCVEFGGEYQDMDGGIFRGCPLSPILGALYLQALDDQFDTKNVYYIRYMADILILSKTRWQNRKVVKQLNRCLDRLKLTEHPDKTFIGKIEKGFDFLDYHFSKEPLKIARITWQKHALQIIRLYEQLRIKKATSKEMAVSLGLYVTRWQRWAVAGLSSDRFALVEPYQPYQGSSE